MKATIDDDPDFVPRVIEEVRAANITDRLVVISFNHDLLRQAKQLMPELKVGVLVYGAMETMALPTACGKCLVCRTVWKRTIFHSPMFSVENVDDEKLQLDAAPDGKSDQYAAGELSGRVWRGSPAPAGTAGPGKVQTLDFKPDWVSCEYHTAYQQPSMVQKLHDLGIKTAYWTVDETDGKKKRPLAAAAGCHRHKPSRPRAEWIAELEMTE